MTPAPDPLAVRRVSCRIDLLVAEAAIVAFQVAPAVTAGEVIEEQVRAVVDDRDVAVQEILGPLGTRIHIVAARGQWLTLFLTSAVRPATEAPLAGSPAPTDFDSEAIEALRQSRYAPSDSLIGFARAELAHCVERPELAGEVAAWVHGRLHYDVEVSRHLDSAVDTLLANAGVCRDFAHLTIGLCRALGIPARIAAVYAPGLSPMDFHAVVEVRVGDRWEVLDPTRMAPRQTLVRIATGRDSADTAFATTLRGGVTLTGVEVFATVDGLLPDDDHLTAIALR